MKNKVSFLNLENTLRGMGSQVSAAETHGIIAGILTLRPTLVQAKLENTLIENLDCRQVTQEQWDMINQAGKQIADSFAKQDFSFDLLLPEDTSELEHRLDALGCWCRGYLSGLGIVGIGDSALNNAIVKELVQDLSQIAHVSLELTQSDEDEANYIELVEFVRVSVQNIEQELRDANDSQQLH